MNRINWLGVLAATAIMSVTACKRETSPTVVDPVSPVATNEPSTNEATAVPGTQNQAVEQIAQARCDREVRCGKVGPDKDYTSQEVCLTKVKDEWRDDLNARECPGGVVQKELTECLAEIRNEDCGNPFDSLSRIIACREGDICKGT